MPTMSLTGQEAVLLEALLEQAATAYTSEANEEAAYLQWLLAEAPSDHPIHGICNPLAPANRWRYQADLINAIRAKLQQRMAADPGKWSQENYAAWRRQDWWQLDYAFNEQFGGG